MSKDLEGHRVQWNLRTRLDIPIDLDYPENTIVAAGINGNVYFDGEFLHIERSSFRSLLTKQNWIPLKSISSIEIESRTLFASGFIRFDIVKEDDTKDAHSSINNQDINRYENTVKFNTDQQPDFIKLYNAIKKSQSALQPTTIELPTSTSNSLSEDLRALSNLRDKGILSEDDFEKAKKKLLE